MTDTINLGFNLSTQHTGTYPYTNKYGLSSDHEWGRIVESPADMNWLHNADGPSINIQYRAIRQYRALTRNVQLE